MTFQPGDPGHVTEHNHRKTVSDAEHNDDGTHKLIAAAPHVAAVDPHGDRAHSDTADSAHVAATDPHGDRADAASKVSTHAAASDPHGDRANTTSQISTHSAASDPHGDRAAATSALTTHEASSTDHPQRSNYAPTGLTGATAAARFVGGTTSGAPSTGTFAVGDMALDQTGTVWICTGAGSPGTWVDMSSGKELAYASSNAAQSSIGNTRVDVTGCSITFTVGTRPVMVEAFIPYVAGSVSGDTAILEIRDENNNSLEESFASIPGANKDVQMRIYQHITTPGTYTRKLTIYRNAAGTGTLSINLSQSAPFTNSFIRAVQN